MTRAVDVGYPRQKQYVGGAKARMHAVEKDDRGNWVLVCNGKPGVRQYKGWYETVACRDCRTKLNLGVDEEES